MFLWFMGSEHLQKLDVSWGHEPATDRSADSLVREFLGLDSRGHGCPRPDRRFMKSLYSLLRTHWDHEPWRSGVSAERRNSWEQHMKPWTVRPKHER